MQTLAINENNDIYRDLSGNLAVAKDLNAMGKIFINKTQTLKNEMLYSDKGIDFFNTIFSSPSYPDLFQNGLTNQILETDSTIDVQNYQEDLSQENIYKYSLEIETKFGKVYLNG